MPTLGKLVDRSAAVMWRNTNVANCVFAPHLPPPPLIDYRMTTPSMGEGGGIQRFSSFRCRSTLDPVIRRPPSIRFSSESVNNIFFCIGFFLFFKKSHDDSKKKQKRHLKISLYYVYACTQV